MNRTIIIFIAIAFIFIGCAPSASIKTKNEVIDIFASFDEVGRPYRKVQEIEAIDQRGPKRRNRNRGIENLIKKARTQLVIYV